MLGTCMYCDQKRMVEDKAAEEYAQIHMIPIEQAADCVAARECNCSGASLVRQRDETLELATDYLKNLFENNPKVLEMCLKGIEAVISQGIDKLTFKKSKKTYSIYLDALGCLKVKTVFSDKEEAKF